MLATSPRILSKPRIAFLLHHWVHCSSSRSPALSINYITSSTSSNCIIIRINKMDTSREVDLRSMRVPYKEDEHVLLEHNLPTKDPLELFKLWFQEAKSCPTIKEPNAVCLTTATSDGVPSSRMVLLKAFGPFGFKIFTNLSSRKGSEMKQNPKASLLFYWDAFNKQIRIEGPVTFLTADEGDEYFHLRPRTSQLAAAASNQSQPIESRDALIRKYTQLEELYAGKIVPRPSDWGGICLMPNRYEFWQGQSSRLHDRIVFTKTSDGGNNGNDDGDGSKDEWSMERLQP